MGKSGRSQSTIENSWKIGAAENVMEQKTLVPEVDRKLGKKPGGKSNLLAFTTALFFLSTLGLGFLSFTFYQQIHSSKQSVLTMQQKFTEMEKERDQAVTLTEGLRADLVSYDAMAKRLEIEKKRAADAEAKLKELEKGPGPFKEGEKA